MSQVSITTLLSKQLNFFAYETKWIPNTSRIVCVGSNQQGRGVVQVFDIQNSQLIDVSSLINPKAVKCCNFSSFSSSRNIAIGDFEGNISIHDLNQFEKPIWNVRGHASVVNSIDGAPLTNSFAPELVSGSRDGTVCVWDQRTNKPVAKFRSKTAGADVWNVSFCSSFGIERGILIGADTGDMKLIDLKNMQVIYQNSFERGVTSVAHGGQNLAVCGTHGQLQFASFSPSTDSFQWTKPKDSSMTTTVWTANFFPQNQNSCVVTDGSGWISLYILDNDKNNENNEWKLRKSENLSTKPVLCLDWNQDEHGLFTYTDLHNVKVAYLSS